MTLRSRSATDPGRFDLGCGINLHREHYDSILAGTAAAPWFEAITENFLTAGGRPGRVLELARERGSVALHGVSLSLGSDEPLRRRYLRGLAELVERVEPVLVSDHLCWTGLGGHNSHDLLPLPFTEDAVRKIARKIRRVQDYLGRRILVENISTYARFRGSALREWEFVAAVVEEGDCGLLLDVNNVYVDSRNHGFDPEVYFAALPADRVIQYHVAGHEDHGDHVLDTHDRDVADPVWELFAKAVGRFGPRPTILERDEQVPAPELLERERARAQGILAAGRR
jgi:hypothetical protein